MDIIGGSYMLITSGNSKVKSLNFMNCTDTEIQTVT